VPQSGPRPEDTYEMEIWVSDAEQTLDTVPENKFARKIFGILAVSHTGNATSWFAIRKYNGDTLEKEWKFVLGAYDTLDISRPLESPILTIEAGREIRTIGGAPTSVFLVLNYYDL